MLICDKWLGILQSQLEHPTKFSDCPSPPFVSAANLYSGASSASSVDTAEFSFTEEINRQLKLTPEDKNRIARRFQGLDEKSMWKLSTGTIVEKKMEELALICEYEHPCHSMILDTNDKNWEGYFTKDEIKEIKAFEKKNFETLPSGLEEYIDSLKKYTNADTLESKLTEVPDCPARDWVRRTLLDHLRLFKYNRELILYNYTKEDLLRRVYLFLDTVLDDSKLNCYGGRASKRFPSGGEVDLLFVSVLHEVGCVICERYYDNSKELHYGSFKMVKLLKNMIYKMSTTMDPEAIRELHVVGYLIFGNEFTLIHCDAPKGYVTRIARSSTIRLPSEADNLTKQLLSILKAVYRVRLTMERTAIVSRKMPEDDTFELFPSRSEPELIVPNFNRENTDNNKRRRLSVIEPFNI